MPQFTSDELKNKSSEELSTLAERNHILSAEGVLIKEEWERRARIEQHKLDIDLIAKQVRSMRFAAILGVLATLAGAIIGAYLQHMWSQQPLRYRHPPVQEQSGPSSVVAPHTKTVSPDLTKEIGDSSLSKIPPRNIHE